MDILIGFEFEFGWKKKDNGSYDYDFKVFNTVKKEIKNALGSEFLKNVHEVISDGSLCFPKKDGDVCGVEVVTKPMEEAYAIEFCKTFLRWMKKEERIITNKTCSLHINLSFKNKKINEKIDYFTLLQTTPEKLILEMFGRQKNKYCIASSDKKFCLNIKNKFTPKHKIDYWLKKVGSQQITTTLRTTNYNYDKNYTYSKGESPRPKGKQLQVFNLSYEASWLGLSIKVI